MILRIEPESALYPCFGRSFAIPKSRSGKVRLKFKIEKQQQERWCWAAIAVSMARYYHKAAIQQWALTGKILKVDCSPGNTENAGFSNQNCTLDKALREVETYSHWSLGKPTFERIQYEINLGQPVCVRIEWYKGGAHYVVITGYNSRRREIFIADSMYSSSIHVFSSFPATYHFSGGVWTDTFWTKGKAGSTLQEESVCSLIY